MSRIGWRRRLVVAALAAGALGWIGKRGTPCVDAAQAARPAPDDDAMARFCSALHCPDSIGKACRAALPLQEATAASLESAIRAALPGGARNETSQTALTDAIRRGSRRDFQEGRVVSVNGWVLSLTETRVYAFAGLHSAARQRTG